MATDRQPRLGIAKVDFYGDDWLTGTSELTPEQRGVFITLCALYWSKNGRVPENDRWLAGMCNLSTRRWRMVKAELCALGKIDFVDGFLFQERAEIEFENAVKVKDMAKIKGRKGGQKSAELRANMLNRNSSGASPAKTPAQAAAQAGGQPPYPYPNTTSQSRDNTSTARAREGSEQKILEALECNPGEWRGDFLEFTNWLSAGFDLELDILPVIRSIRSKRDIVWANKVSLRYFTSAIREQHERRQAGGGLSPNGSAPRALDESERLMQDSIDRRAGERIEKLHNLGIKIPTKKGQDGFDLIWEGTDKEFDEWAEEARGKARDKGDSAA